MAFDPYESWLGITAAHRPPTYYHLLGLSPFESDPATIEQAALRRMSKVRQYQIGPHGDVSQEILAELARARLVLIDPDPPRPVLPTPSCEPAATQLVGGKGSDRRRGE